VSATSDDWVTVRISPGSHRDAVIAAMFDAGVQGLEEAGDTLVTHVAGQTFANEVLCAVMAVSSDARVETTPLANVDWSEQWKLGIHVQTLGTLFVAPPWLFEGLDPARTIVIEPGMAFGTGEHATTRGVIRLLQNVIRPGDRVADLGAGSAVLAIAAAKLGASRVAAIELDHDAIGNAEENIVRNEVAIRVTIIEGDATALLPLVAPVRVITANIISSVLIELLPIMAASLTHDGCAILSGILVSEREEMVRVFTESGWRIVEEDREDNWWSATIARP
jgi:ribosomal protein L11 methyltransferase